MRGAEQVAYLVRGYGLEVMARRDDPRESARRVGPRRHARGAELDPLPRGVEAQDRERARLGQRVHDSRGDVDSATEGRVPSGDSGADGWEVGAECFVDAHRALRFGRCSRAVGALGEGGAACE